MKKHFIGEINSDTGNLIQQNLVDKIQIFTRQLSDFGVIAIWNKVLKDGKTLGQDVGAFTKEDFADCFFLGFNRKSQRTITARLEPFLET